MLLGQDTPEFDSRIWMWLIFAALSVFGSLFGKKKKDKEEAELKKRRQAAQQRRSVASPSPSSSAIEQKPNFVPPIPPVARAASAPRPASRPEIMQYEQQVEEYRAEPEVVEYEAEPVESEVIAEPVDLSAALPAVSFVAARRNVHRQEIRRLLGSRTGLRSGFILSELLAPPVGMRHNP